MRSRINSLRKEKCTSVVTVGGIDLAKNVFALHGVNGADKVDLLGPSVPRAKLRELVAALPPCTIGIAGMLRRASMGARVRRLRPHGQADGTEVRHPVPAKRPAR